MGSLSWAVSPLSDWGIILVSMNPAGASPMPLAVAFLPAFLLARARADLVFFDVDFLTGVFSWHGFTHSFH